MDQKAFEEIKKQIIENPVLHLPENESMFQFFSDTSKKQLEQLCTNANQKQIGYARKR